jgi:hypothetical protein
MLAPVTFSALRMSVARLMPSLAVLYSSSQGLPWCSGGNTAAAAVTAAVVRTLQILVNYTVHVSDKNSTQQCSPYCKLPWTAFSFATHEVHTQV